MALFWKKLNSPQSFVNHDFTSNFLELALLYDVLRNAKFTTVRKRLDLPHDLLCKYDTEMVSSVNESSLFLVHQDNVMEVSVALLKELRLVSSDVGNVVSNGGNNESTDLDNTEVVYLDTAKLEYAQTGKEPAQIRKVNESFSVLCSPTGGLRHFASADLTAEQLNLILNDKAQEINFDELDGSRKLAIGWVQRKQAKAMSKVTYSRNRFSYVNDDDDESVIGATANNLQTNIWATMDSNIKLQRVSGGTESSTSSQRTFPHSVLEIRWKGTSKPKWISELETNSHLVYPMKHGFSLYAYSVASFYSDKLQKLPTWVDIIDNGVEIRHAPKVTTSIRRSANSGVNLASGTARSGKTTPLVTPSILLNDSHQPGGVDYFSDSHNQKNVSKKPSMTAVDNNVQSDKSPQMLSRVSSFYNPTSRQQHRLLSQPSESKLAVRYWNEFDDGDEGEDLGVFVIPDEDASGSYQDKLFSEANIDAIVRVSDKFLQSFTWLTTRLITGKNPPDGYERLHREGGRYNRRGSDDSEEYDSYEEENDDDEEDDEDDYPYDEEASVGRYSPRIKPRSSSSDNSEYSGYSTFPESRSTTIAAKKRNNVLTFLYAMCLLLAALIITVLLTVTILEDVSEISLGTYVFMIIGFIFALGISMLGLSLYLLCKSPPWWQQTVVFASFFSIVCFGVGGIAWILA